MNRVHIIKILKWTATTALLVYVFQTYIDVHALADLLPLISPWYLVLALVANLVVRYLRSIQLLWGLEPFDFKLSLWQIIRIQELTAFYTLILPGTIAGGSVTVFLLSKDTGHRAQALSVVAYLFLLTWASLIPFVIVGIIYEPRLSDLGVDALLYTFLAVSTVAMVPFLSSKAALRVESLGGTVANRLPARIAEPIKRVLYSVRVSSGVKPRTAIRIIVVAVLMQIVQVVGLWFSALAIGIDLPWSVFFWLRGVLSLVAVAPLLAGGTGLRELGLVYILTSFYGCSAESALLFSLFQMIKIVILSVVTGLFFSFVSKDLSQLIVRKQPNIQ